MNIKEFERVVRQAVMIAKEHIEDGFTSRDVEQMIIDYYHAMGINSDFSKYPDRKMVIHVYIVAQQLHGNELSQEEAFTKLGKVLNMKLV